KRLTATARGARLSRRPRSCDGSRSSRASRCDRARVDRPAQTRLWWQGTRTLTARLIKAGRGYEQIGPVHISEVRTVRLALWAIFFVGLAGCMSLGKKPNCAAAASPTSLARPAGARDASVRPE